MLRYCGNRIVEGVLFLFIVGLAMLYGGNFALEELIILWSMQSGGMQSTGVISIVALMFWSYGFLETLLITVLNLSIYFVSH